MTTDAILGPNEILQKEMEKSWTTTERFLSSDYWPIENSQESLSRYHARSYLLGCGHPGNRDDHQPYADETISSMGDHILSQKQLVSCI